MRSRRRQCLITVGDNIRKVRIAKGVSLKVLSERIDITIATVSKIERAVIDANLSRIEQIADVLGTSMVSLFSGEISKMETKEQIVAHKKMQIKKLDLQIIALQEQIIAVYDQLKTLPIKSTKRSSSKQ